MLGLQNTGMPALELGGARVTGVPIGARPAKVDLDWALTETFTEDGKPAGSPAR